MTERIRVALSLLAALVVMSPLAAQERYEAITPLPVGSFLLSTPSNHVAPAGAWEVRFAHRFNGSIDDDGVHTLLGMDSGANVTMGVSYAPRRDVEVTLLRSNVMDDYELAAKYVVMQQAAAIPATLALRAGTDWRTEHNLGDRTSIFAQAIVSRRAGRFEIFAVPTIVTNSGRAVSGSGSAAMFTRAINVPVALVFMLASSTSLVAEWTPANRDLPKAIDSDDGWAIGIKRAIGGHHFDVMLTNNLGTTVDEYTSSIFQGSPLRRGELHIGFNIGRRFGGAS